MNNFIKSCIKFLIPALTAGILFVAIYIVLDPFKVIHNYSNYSNIRTGFNRDYISTETFLKNYKTQQYNSFIFGSSRSQAFLPSNWKKHLSPSDNVFSFDASGETVYGIWKKLQLIDKLGLHINNALIILCRDVSFLRDDNYEDIIYTKHPILSGENEWYFQYKFFRAFTVPKFLTSYGKFLINKKYDPSMEGYIVNHHVIMDSISNELIILEREQEIHGLKKEFYKRTPRVESKNIIGKNFYKMLTDIHNILTKHNSKYRVVISPLYEQIKFSPQDINTLKNIFRTNLYDFSGENIFTNNSYYYYEASHYRTIVGDSIMQYIYP